MPSCRLNIHMIFSGKISSKWSNTVRSTSLYCTVKKNIKKCKLFDTGITWRFAPLQESDLPPDRKVVKANLKSSSDALVSETAKVNYSPQIKKTDSKMTASDQR